MYLFINEANLMISQYLSTIPNDKSKIFYKTRLNKFFSDYMSLKQSTRPINKISSFEINSFISDIEFSLSEQSNYYFALKGFFTYAYHHDLISNEVIKGVVRPLLPDKSTEYMGELAIKKLTFFIEDRNKKIKDRLLIAFFLYTGLSRQYAACLTDYHLRMDERLIHFDFGETVKVIPICDQLYFILNEFLNSNEYQKSIEFKKSPGKIFLLGDNYISKKLKILSIKITGEGYTPTHFSSTFIRHALDQCNNDVLSISQLILESVETINYHTELDQEKLIATQRKILNKLFIQPEVNFA